MSSGKGPRAPRGRHHCRAATYADDAAAFLPMAHVLTRAAAVNTPGQRWPPHGITVAPGYASYAVLNGCGDCGGSAGQQSDKR